MHAQRARVLASVAGALHTAAPPPCPAEQEEDEPGGLCAHQSQHQRGRADAARAAGGDLRVHLARRAQDLLRWAGAAQTTSCGQSRAAGWCWLHRLSWQEAQPSGEWLAWGALPGVGCARAPPNQARLPCLLMPPRPPREATSPAPRGAESAADELPSIFWYKLALEARRPRGKMTPGAECEPLGQVLLAPSLWLPRRDRSAGRFGARRPCVSTFCSLGCMSPLAPPLPGRPRPQPTRRWSATCLGWCGAPPWRRCRWCWTTRQTAARCGARSTACCWRPAWRPSTRWVGAAGPGQRLCWACVLNYGEVALIVATVLVAGCAARRPALSACLLPPRPRPRPRPPSARSSHAPPRCVSPAPLPGQVDEVVDSVVVALSRFAAVLAPPKGVEAYGESAKARAALETMFAIANR